MFSESDILAISKQACAESDNKAIILADSHALNYRLNTIIKTLPNTVKNIDLNYKVYLDTQPNAWSTANGCIRVNSGLIKLLTDNELQAVLAHEQAHIALKHAIKLFKQAAYIEITNKADEIVVMMQKDIVQQYEIDADNYALNLLIKEKIDPQGLINLLYKIPFHPSEQLSSHPSTVERVNNLLEKLQMQ
jgi:Zn-dependent protease with chaperone function